MKKILYLSCHEVLESDELTLFTELGHELFSPGAYVCNENKGDNGLRPQISGFKDNRNLLNKWHDLAQTMPGKDPKYQLSYDFISNFDIVIVMHIPEWISGNWNVFRPFIQNGGRVIWRTIGQSISNTEKQIAPFRNEGLEIVRYSPMERNIPGYIGEDVLIRFYKDEMEYRNWTGEELRVVTFAQSMKQRGPACNFDIFEQSTRPYRRSLYGPGNEEIGEPWAFGKVSFEKQKDILKKSRCFFHTGTHPASYTLGFIESLMTGIPIVAIGFKYGNASYFTNHKLYEIQNIIKNGINGFISDDIKDLQTYIHKLLSDKKLAESISLNGRQTAIELFGKSKIKKEWRQFLEK